MEAPTFLPTNLKLPGSTCNVTSGNCSPAGDLDCALADPQVRHRDRWWNLTDGDGDSIKVSGTPLKFAGRLSCEHAHPHRLGADTADILRGRRMRLRARRRKRCWFGMR